MSKNQQTVNEPQGEELVGNLEMAERQLTYLLTIKSYLSMQLDQVEIEIEKIQEKLKTE